MYKPTWDEYFLTIAKTISLRSDDHFVKHGAVVVDENNHIIGTGYNALARKLDDTYIDRSNRNLRRERVIHAEENAILNTLHLRISKKMTIYISGEPCIDCFERIWNFGINRVVYIDGMSYHLQEEQREIKEKFLAMTQIEVTKYQQETIQNLLRNLT